MPNLDEMYEPKAGSPLTVTTSDFDSGDSEVYVEKPEHFPDGPNIAVLCDEDDFETIIYQSKDGSVLQNVERAVEGTEKSWPIGTVIARLITAKDIESLQNNIQEVKDGVVEVEDELSDVEDNLSDVAESGHWNDLEGVPNTFPPENHGNERHTEDFLTEDDLDDIEAGNGEDEEHGNELHTRDFIYSDDNAYEIQKDGNDMNGVINFKT